MVGVYGGNADPMPMMTIFDKQLTVRFGQANVQRWLDDLVPLAEADDDPLGFADFATHRAPSPRRRPCTTSSRRSARAA